MSWDAMLRDKAARGLTDRVALSNELAELADTFAIEATYWKEPKAKEALKWSARLLSEQSRAALHTSTDDAERVLQAYAEAATILIRNIEGTRRFFGVVLTPPRKRDDQ